MKALVTGATGFVGACLARRLLESGHEVHALVRRTANQWRIADIVPHIVLHDVDLRDAHGVEQALAASRPELIFHLATYGGFSFQKDVAAIHAVNFQGTVNLVQAAEKVGFDCFINSGSSSEYGLKSAPMKETDLLEPLGDYAVSKAAATLYCSSEALQKGLPLVNLRLFSPYGPWDDPQRLIPYVIASLLNFSPPALSSRASVRDYIYIDDVVRAYEAVSKAPITPGAIYNVGSGRQTTIGAVVDTIVSSIGNGIQPVWGAEPLRRAEPAVWVANTGKLQAHCNWQAATGLQDGLQRTIGWMGEHLDYYIQER
jgi:nucleoside-diphosphate-sugar epimerase